MPKKVTCPNCKKSYILAGFEEVQIELVNKAVEKFAEQILRILNSDPGKTFKSEHSSVILKECIDKILELRQNSIVPKERKGSFKKFLRKVFSPFTS